MISIFTPTHTTEFLPELYDSLLKQTDTNWEWVLLYNNNCEPMKFEDPRVKIYYDYNIPPWVGPLKAAACEKCTGEILFELDSDDVLMPTAVAEVRKAFEDPQIGFVYSNTVHSNEKFEKIQPFSSYYGWKYREVTYKDSAGNEHVLDEHISFPPTPESLSRIYFAPNHLRAFRKSVYEQVGGYNKEMRVLDDIDLMDRLYLVTKFYHIDKGLYIYRVSGKNSWIRYNEEIQNNVYRLYDKYIEQLAERWCASRGLRKIEVGGRMAAKKGYETVDLKDAEIIADLEKTWPFEDNSIGIVRSYDVFEHLHNPIHTMKELSRVLVPGGWCFGQVPSTDGRGAFQAPDHVSFWNENSFLYYTNANKAKYIDTPVKFQAPRLYTTLKDAEQVCWVVFHLINCKDGYRPCGAFDF